MFVVLASKGSPNSTSCIQSMFSARKYEFVAVAAVAAMVSGYLSLSRNGTWRIADCGRNPATQRPTRSCSDAAMPVAYRTVP